MLCSDCDGSIVAAKVLMLITQRISHITHKTAEVSVSAQVSY